MGHEESAESADEELWVLDPAPRSAPAWCDYLTPPRRTSRKRTLSFQTFQNNNSNCRQTAPEPPQVPVETSFNDGEIPRTRISSPTPADAVPPTNKNRTGLFRRFRNPRARRLAEYEQATLGLPSPPSSGNNSTSQGFRCIPADHPGKILWDTLTVLLSLLNAYYTHIAIRERRFDDVTNSFKIFACLWFLVDILLNFVTEHRIGNVTLKTVSAVSARYLTTWFVIDLLSLVPGEVLYVQPVIEKIKSRGLFKKLFFRTKSAGKVTGKLLPRWRELRQFGALYHKHKGLGGIRRLVVRLIKYLPKYVLFLRHMKGVIAVRFLRQVHWFRKAYYNIMNLAAFVFKKKEEQEKFVIRKAHYESDDDTLAMTYDDDDKSQEYFWEEEDEEDFDDGDPY